MELIRTLSNPVIGGTWVNNKSITNEIDFVVDNLQMFSYEVINTGTLLC